MAKRKNNTETDYARLGKSLTYVLERDYMHVSKNWKRFIFTSLVRGIFVGLGSIIGATIVVALLIMILNAVGGLPWVGGWFEAIREQLNTGSRATLN